MAELRVVVAGAGGRMGRALTRAVLAEPKLQLVGALDRADAEAQGKDVGASRRRRRDRRHGRRRPAARPRADRRASRFHRAGRRRSPTPSSPRRRASSTSSARPASRPRDEARLKAAARHCRIVKSGNMSLGVNVLAGLVKRAAAVLGPDYDIEIVEMHHRHKVDAPSGTALLLGRAAAEGRGIELVAEIAARARRPSPARGRTRRSASPASAAAPSSATTW